MSGAAPPGTSDEIRTMSRPTDRIRGGTMFTEKRTNAWAALVGFYIGRGRLAPQIASILSDGTSPGTIRSLTCSWGLPTSGRREAIVPVQLSAARRRKLQAEARRLRCSPEELARRLLLSILDDDRVDETLAPRPPVPDRMVPRSDRASFHDALAKLSPDLYAKAVNAFPWVDLYERPDGRIRVELAAPERLKSAA